MAYVEFTNGPDLVAKLTALGAGITSTFIPQTLDAMAKELKDTMVSKEHYITHAMQNSTNYVKNSDEQITFSVKVVYASVENKRPGSKGALGPHNFWEPSIEMVSNNWVKAGESRFNAFVRSTIGD